MTTLVTGATGMVGNNIVRLLAKRGRPVRALVRDLDKAAKLLPEGVELTRGDITDRPSLDRAMEGCSVVYHGAGLPEQWLPSDSTFDEVNVGGTRHTVEAAMAAGVSKFLYTSTIDTFTFPARGGHFDESELDPAPKHTAYERSKQEADRVVVDAECRGLATIYLHPSGVYGPGPASSPGTNQLIADLVMGKVPMLLPGGMPVVFSTDVAEGHILAEEKAELGARYILSESYQSLQDFAAAVRSVTTTSKVPITMPLGVAGVVATVGEWVSGFSGRPPLLPKGQLTFLQYEARPDASRAREDLGWRPTAFVDGLAATVSYLREHWRIG
jgi:dihydroflavonol-4-reductase